MNDMRVYTTYDDYNECVNSQTCMRDQTRPDRVRNRNAFTLLCCVFVVHVYAFMICLITRALLIEFTF